MIPMKPRCSTTCTMLRTGWTTRPAEKSIRARSMAGMRSSRRKRERTAASSRKRTCGALWGAGCIGGESAFQFRKQVGGVNGFRENLKLVSLGTSVLQQVGGGCLAGKQQDFTGRQKATNADGGFDAIHIGHDDVADDEIGLQRARAFHGRCAGVHRRGVIPVKVEDFGQGVGNNLLVVNYQNSRFVTRVHALRSFRMDRAELPIIAEDATTQKWAPAT